MEATIVIPVYNEVDAIDKEMSCLLEAEFVDQFEVIIVDDGSTDGTSERLKDISSRMTRDNVSFLFHEMNRGYGAALKTGIAHAGTAHIIITDADNSYPNEKIPELFDIYQREGQDMVVGARTNRNGATPFVRRFAKWCLRKLANYLTEARIPDLNSGLRVFRKDVVLQNLNLICDGFSFTTTLTLIMMCNVYQVKYVPIDYHKRTGTSKIKPIKDTANFIYLILSTVLYFRPLRVFMPPGIILFLLSGFLGVYQVIALRNITTVTVLVFQLSIFLLALGMFADLIIKSRPQPKSGSAREKDIPN